MNSPTDLQPPTASGHVRVYFVVFCVDKKLLLLYGCVSRGLGTNEFTNLIG